MAILITGASSGIGLALAQHFAREKRNVIACGRNPKKLSDVFGNQENVSTLAFDVSMKEQVLAQSSQVEQLDMLILNAGDCEYFDEVVPFDSEKFERIIKVNLLSMAYCLEAFLDKISPNGRVVIVSSSVVLVPFARAEAYGASKAAASYLANSLAIDLASKNINVSLVEPGFVKTPLTDRNKFEMPFLISSEKAAEIIVKGINKNKSRIRFPSSLMIVLHLLSLLPIKCLAKLFNRK